MLRKQKYYEKNVWPGWLGELRKSSHNLVFLPGIMGSELYEKKSEDTRWIELDTINKLEKLEYKIPTPSGSIDTDEQFIFARATVNPPVGSSPYFKFLECFKPGPFCYDWRESIPIEAERLRLFLKLVAKQNDYPINFVTHSMGGCLLLSVLMNTSKFDDKIGKIIFCAPPFHGALKPIRVIEEGKGTPLDAASWLIMYWVLRQSAVTMPGLFQLLVAPSDSWPTEVKIPTSSTPIKLEYPIRVAESIYRVGAWSNHDRLDIFGKILGFAKRYHCKKSSNISNVVKRLRDKIYVIVGLNGKTAYCATRSAGKWVLHSLPKPNDGKYANGDGTVLFQSSLLPGLPEDHYWAEIPKVRENIHGEILERPKVIAGIKAILRQGNIQNSGLKNYRHFVPRIDWSHESNQSSAPKPTDNLNYIERELLRRVTPRGNWGTELNPGGRDAELFAITRQAALQVLNGDDLESAADRIRENRQFLEGHIRTLLMPLLD